MQNRVQSLDYLRGLMAAAIMIYHYFLWSGSKFPAETILGRLGIYGVSIFYVLSGLTLYVVYNHKLSFGNLHTYFLKRFFRIFPLLWLCIALTIYFSPRDYNLYTIFLNISGFFGLIAPSKYIAAASWSIGNELFFYLLFPVILLSGRKYPRIWLYIIAASFLVAFYFAFNIIESGKAIASQWKIYVNPLNQVVLFISGVALGKYLSAIVFPRFSGLMLIGIAVLIFIFYPVTGNGVNLVSGINRLLFIVLSVTITAGFFITQFKSGKVPSIIFGRLGEISYSVYLLHPLVFNFFKKQLHVNDKLFLLSLSFTGTIMLSFLVYTFYEKKFILLGQMISNYRSILIRVPK